MRIIAAAIISSTNVLEIRHMDGFDFNDQDLSFTMPNVYGYDTMKCECGCETFIRGYIFKKVPGILFGGGVDEVPVPLEVFYCSKCGMIPEFIKKKLKSEEDKAKKAEEAKKTLIV
jgi:hypothetical protein